MNQTYVGSSKATFRATECSLATARLPNSVPTLSFDSRQKLFRRCCVPKQPHFRADRAPVAFGREWAGARRCQPALHSDRRARPQHAGGRRSARCAKWQDRRGPRVACSRSGGLRRLRDRSRCVRAGCVGGRRDLQPDSRTRARPGHCRHHAQHFAADGRLRLGAHRPGGRVAPS